MEVYEPREDSELLAKYVRKFSRGRVLDMGTGPGIQAIAAAENIKVREILAVDINPKAVNYVNKIIKEKKIKKIKTKVSDLFSKVEGKFDTIIFNPPYLPQDEGIEDVSLYGGRKGWEVLGRFFDGVGEHLVSKGQILVVFSSLTDKEKVDGIIGGKMLEFEELEKKRLPMFEELYIYLVWKAEVLRKLEGKGVAKINYFAHGKRGDVFVGVFDRSKLVKTHLAKPEMIKVGIKVKRKESLAVERIRNEVKWLKVLNKAGIGPKLLFYGDIYLVYKFVEGEFILDWINKNKENKEKIKKTIINVLGQCFKMDELGVNKEEMHRPVKHIIIGRGGEITLIDFERCYETKKPHNVTQFGQFLINQGLVEKGMMMEKLRKYKEEIGKESFEEILKLINHS